MNSTQLIRDNAQRTKKNLQKLFMSAIVIAISFATLATMRIKNNPVSSTDSIKLDFARAASAPYQDGLYLGSLAAKEGTGFHVSAGRWRTQEELGAFADGYRSGFNAATFPMVENQAK